MMTSKDVLVISLKEKLDSKLILDTAYTHEDHLSRSNDVWANFKYHLTLRMLETYWTKDGKPRVYDLGCGSGYFSRKLSRLGYDVVGVEPDRDAFAIASSSRLADSASFLNISIDKINIESDADVVIMHDVLEHIDAEHATLLSVSTLLRDSGLLIISVPASELLFGHHDHQLGHFRRYSKASLRRALNPMFDIQSIRYLGAIGIFPILLFSKILKTSYPVASDKSVPFTQRLFGWLLHIEWLLHIPFGGGLIVIATKRGVPSDV